jgi:hypothetical protein
MSNPPHRPVASRPSEDAVLVCEHDGWLWPCPSAPKPEPSRHGRVIIDYGDPYVEATDANPERVDNGCMIFRRGA